MTRSLATAMAFFLQLVITPASAQVLLQSTTSTTAEVTVTGRVTTTTTDTLLVPDAEVFVEPAAAPTRAALAPLLALRGEFSLSGAHDMPLAGMTALLGMDGADGWGGGLVAGYFGELSTNAPSEVHLALEGWRDFGPTDTVGFRLVARAGTALALEASGPSPRALAQLGIGTRVSIDPRIAILLDARGELLLRPASVRGDLANGPEVSAGLVLTTAVAIRLD